MMSIYIYNIEISVHSGNHFSCIVINEESFEMK